MAAKDISDLHVCEAYRERWGNDIGRPSLDGFSIGALVTDRPPTKFVDAILKDGTGQPAKVVYRAMERAYSRGYIEYGVSLRSGWLTEKGLALLNGNQP
jgi:hypothetical protein